MSKQMTSFFDGSYYVEDVAAARIANMLSHQSSIKLSEKQVEDIARTIMGAMLGYLLGSDSYYEFVDCRKEKMMGREDHGVLLDSKNQWWVQCPNSDFRIPEDEEPKYCPHCGENIAPKTEDEKE